jgi:hypothetical protein
VDVTRVQIQKPQGLVEKLFYSKKDKFHALKYEVVVSNAPNQKIVWMAGPCLGVVSDIRISREGGLLDSLGFGEQLLGDKGYVGDPRLNSLQEA